MQQHSAETRAGLLDRAPNILLKILVGEFPDRDCDALAAGA